MFNLGVSSLAPIFTSVVASYMGVSESRGLPKLMVNHPIP